LFQQGQAQQDIIRQVYSMIRIGVLPSLAVIALLAGSGAAAAQAVGPVEAVEANGTMRPKPALTAAQERAIYDAVFRQRVRTPTTKVPVAIGAAVPEAVELDVLPDQADPGSGWVTDLKYALVEDDIVLVDPIRMRVVDVIHGGARP
jgi:hypothetical protein